MDNDPVNPSHGNDEEYQFTDDEAARKYESSASAATSSSSVVKNSDTEGARRKKLILIIIGVIVGAFCLYKLYGLFTVVPSKTPLAPTQLQTAVPPPATESVVPASEQINPPQLQPVLTEEKLDKEGLKDKVSSLEQAVLQNGQAQESLQNQIGGISAAITEIQGNIAMLTQQVNTIAQQKSDSEIKLQEKAEAAHKAKEAKKTIKRSSSYSKRKEKKISYGTYYVRAMIQGRAWLVNSSGATLTISTGDQLPGYGEIREIDPDKGIVMTSSGRVIGHMAGDR